MWYLADMEMVLKACVLNNMVACTSGYEGTIKLREVLEEDEDKIMPLQVESVRTYSCNYEQESIWRQLLDEKEEAEHHRIFTDALVDHIWNSAGDDK